MTPAHRLGTSLPDAHDGVDDPGWHISSHNPGLRPPLRPDRPSPRPQAALRRSDPYFRPGASKRRRDVLMVLLCTLTVTGLIGAIPAMHLLLAVTAFVALVLTAYLYLLVRLRNHALEREVKLRYLPRHTDYDSPIVVRRAASR